MLLSTHQTEDVTALCQRVVVVDRGRTLFDGTPSALAATGAGRVWLSDRDEPTAELSWVDGLGRHRHIGEPPPGADVTEPTLEDGYLLLVGRHPEADDGVDSGTGRLMELLVVVAVIGARRPDRAVPTPGRRA